MVKEAWKHGQGLKGKMKAFKTTATDWNKKVFGNIFHKKRVLLNRLQRLEDRLQKDDAELINVINEVWVEYEKTFFQEELFWCQKARVNWLTFGDKNSKFFHAATVIRRKRNRMEMLKNNEGVWVTDQNSLRDMASGYFKNLYTNDMVSYSPLPLSGGFPKLNCKVMNFIHKPISKVEI